jgi:hypothetical protein
MKWGEVRKTKKEEIKEKKKQRISRAPPVNQQTARASK